MSHRLDSSINLFNYNGVGGRTESSKRFCTCSSIPTDSSTAKCEFQPSQTTFFARMKDWVELVAPRANRDNTLQLNKKVFLPTIENVTNYTFKPDEPTGTIPDWPTKSGRTKDKVEEHCNNAIRNSPSGRICSIIPDFPFHHFVQQCITDIQVLFKLLHYVVISICITNFTFKLYIFTIVRY